MPAPGPRRRAWRPDPWPLLSMAVALALFLLLGLGGELDRDPGLYVYGAQRVADGVPPYLGVLNRAGPLAQLVPGGAVAAGRLVGLDDLTSVRLLFLLLSVLVVGAAHVTARDLFGSRTAGVTAGLTMLAFHGFEQYAGWGPREKTLMVLLLLLALWAAIHRRWFSAGVAISLATLTWQPVLVGAFAGVVTAALLGRPADPEARPRRLRAVGLVVLGGAVPAALTLAAYAVTGHLRALLDCFVLINARYTRQPSFFADPARSWSTMVDGYGVGLVAFGLGTLAILALAAIRATRPDRGTPRGAALVGTGVATLGVLAWTLRSFQNWPDLLVALPTAALGVGGLVHVVASRLPRPAGLAVAVAWALAVVGTALAWTLRVPGGDGLAHQQATVDAVFSRLPGDATVLSVESPAVLVLADRVNLTRVQMFGSGFADYLDDTWPGGLDGYARTIDRRRPDVVVVSTARTPSWIGPGLAAYSRVGRATGWTFYLSDAVPSADTQEVRARLHEIQDAEKGRDDGGRDDGGGTDG